MTLNDLEQQGDTVGHEGRRLRPIGLEEEIALEAYREGVKASLASADTAADKVLGASFSIATAYGALLALVKPEKVAAPLLLGLPFALFGLAAIAGAWALAHGVKPLARLRVNDVRGAVDDTLSAKRFWTRIAVVVLVLALVASAFVVLSTYGPKAAGSA